MELSLAANVPRREHSLKNGTKNSCAGVRLYRQLFYMIEIYLERLLPVKNLASNRAAKPFKIKSVLSKCTVHLVQVSLKLTKSQRAELFLMITHVGLVK